MKTSLKQFGLSKEEILIYITALKKGPISPTELARVTGLKRTTLYRYIDKLKNRGLISYKKIGRRYAIEAMSEEAFEALLYQQEEITEKFRKAHGQLAPLINKLRREAEHNSSVEVLTGEQGVKQLINTIVATKQDIRWLGSFKTIMKVTDEQVLFRLLTWRRMDQDTTSYAITDPSILEYKKFSEKIGSFREFRFLSESCPIPALLVLFGDYIALLSCEGEKDDVTVFLMQDKPINALLRYSFSMMWDFLPDNHRLKSR